MSQRFYRLIFCVLSVLVSSVATVALGFSLDSYEPLQWRDKKWNDFEILQRLPTSRDEIAAIFTLPTQKDRVFRMKGDRLPYHAFDGHKNKEITWLHWVYLRKGLKSRWLSNPVPFARLLFDDPPLTGAEYKALGDSKSEYGKISKAKLILGYSFEYSFIAALIQGWVAKAPEDQDLRKGAEVLERMRKGQRNSAANFHTVSFGEMIDLVYLLKTKLTTLQSSGKERGMALGLNESRVLFQMYSYIQGIMIKSKSIYSALVFQGIETRLKLRGPYLKTEALREPRFQQAMFLVAWQAVLNGRNFFRSAMVPGYGNDDQLLELVQSWDFHKLKKVDTLLKKLRDRPQDIGKQIDELFEHIHIMSKRLTDLVLCELSNFTTVSAAQGNQELLRRRTYLLQSVDQLLRSFQISRQLASDFFPY